MRSSNMGTGLVPMSVFLPFFLMVGVVNVILKRIKKGTTSRQQVESGQWAMAAGLELSLYVILGIGGRERSKEHAVETAKVINAIAPDFIRLRTLLPKINTPLLKDIQEGSFKLLGPHEVLTETALLINKIKVSSCLTSDHYTNYINLEGKLPEKKAIFLEQIEAALKKDEVFFRPVYIGEQ